MLRSTVQVLLEKVRSGWRLTGHSATLAPKTATIAVNTGARKGRRVTEFS